MEAAGLAEPPTLYAHSWLRGHRLKTLQGLQASYQEPHSAAVLPGGNTNSVRADLLLLQKNLVSFCKVPQCLRTGKQPTFLQRAGCTDSAITHTPTPSTQRRSSTHRAPPPGDTFCVPFHTFLCLCRGLSCMCCLRMRAPLNGMILSLEKLENCRWRASHLLNPC